MTNTTLHSFAIGLATLDSQQKIIEVYYPDPMLNPEAGTIKAVAGHCAYKGGNADIVLSANQRNAIADDQSLPLDSLLRDTIRNSTAAVVAVFLAEDLVPASVAEVYLKLHLLSHRL